MMVEPKGSRGSSLFSLSMILTTISASVIVDTSMSMCPRGSVYTGGQALVTLPVRSLSECAVRCSETWTCGSFNFCRGQSISCQLMGWQNSSYSCSDLDPALSCRHGMRRKPCENGGTVDGGQCVCPLPYAGDKCQRYMRDCTEGADNVVTSEDDNDVYVIQPVGAPTPFSVFCFLGDSPSTQVLGRWYHQLFHNMTWDKVFCFLGDGASTQVLGRRHHQLFHNMTWDQAVDGIWISAPNDFFIGLHNLHYLSAQAKYRARFKMEPQTGRQHAVAFRDISVGPQSESFQLNFNAAFIDDDVPADEEEVGSPPMAFATADNDPNGCAAVRGGAGWYGTECSSNYSMFAQPLLWPMNGTVEPVDNARLLFFRQSDYY